MDDRETDAWNARPDNVISGGTFAGPILQAHTIKTLSIAAPAAPSWVPRQVPPPRHGFVNRQQELADLGRYTRTGGGCVPPRILVVSGLGGVGKTELVAHWVWTHELIDHYPGGHLYTDLADARRDGAVDVGGVLGGFLRALGVHPTYIPTKAGERAALFRSATADRAVLVVVDNAEHAAEVRPLLPATGLMVVTSRTRLAGLTMDGAERLTVNPLDATASTEMVRTWLDRERGVDTEFAELVGLCGGLPLALRAVAGWMVERPQVGVRQVIAELTDEQRRHGEMSPQDERDSAINAVLDSVYTRFPDHTRRLYHMLGLFPGSTFTEPLALALGADRFDEAVGDLRTGHMVVRSAPDRYRLHDVVRRHAGDSARGHGRDTSRREVLRRAVAFYRIRAEAADRAVLGRRYRLDGDPPAAAAEVFADRVEALEWLEAERHNLVEVLRAAALEGWYDPVWRLCESLWALYDSHKHVGDWIVSHRLGVEAAQAEGRVDAEVRMRNQLARAYLETGELSRAHDELACAETLFRLVTEPRLRGVVWESQGLVALARAQPEHAVEKFTLAREANIEARDQHGVVVQGYNLAQALLAAGRHESAATLADRTMALAQRSDDQPMVSKIGIVQGRVRQARGEITEAVEALTSAARSAVRLGQHGKLDLALEVLVELAEAAHDEVTVSACRAQIAALRAQVGVRRSAR